MRLEWWSNMFTSQCVCWVCLVFVVWGLFCTWIAQAEPRVCADWCSNLGESPPLAHLSGVAPLLFDPLEPPLLVLWPQVLDFFQRFSCPHVRLLLVPLGAKQGGKSGKKILLGTPDHQDSLYGYTHCQGSLGSCPWAVSFIQISRSQGPLSPVFWLERWNFCWSFSCLLELLP